VSEPPAYAEIFTRPAGSVPMVDFQSRDTSRGIDDGDDEDDEDDEDEGESGGEDE